MSLDTQCRYNLAMIDNHKQLLRQEFTERFLIALERRGYGKFSLGKLSVIFSLSRTVLSTLKNGLAIPSIQTGLNMSKELKCSFEWFMTGQGTPEGFQMRDANELALIERYRTLSDNAKQKLLVYSILGGQETTKTKTNQKAFKLTSKKE